MKLALVLLALSGCRTPATDPAWAQAPAGASGEGTLGGAPAALPRFAAPPVIDGKLDDPAWAGAAVLGPLVDPGDGHDAGAHPVAAFARAGWDDTALYVAIVVRDRAPSSPFQHDETDPHIWSKASGVELMLQPGDPGDNKDYFEIQVDVNGAVWDTRFDDYNQPRGDGTYGHQDWKSQVARSVYVKEGSFYAVELALPFAALAPARVAVPPRHGDVWRLNLYSFKDGQRQALAWSPLRGQGNFHRAARFGRIQF